MKLSTRTRYGLRALVDLAIYGTGKPIQLKDIAERQQISLSYLEHLIIPLIAAGFVKSTRGAKGGIELVKTPEQVRLNEVLEVLEGPLAPVDCLRDIKSCSRSGVCATQDLWNELKEAMENVLENTTLQDLVNRQKSKTGAMVTNMYYI
jgi:Rrf2 family transcriptional regulator, cysteine metabolism repressor